MGAIAVHHTATTDEPWDGPGTVAAMPNDKATLHYCHAWEAAGAGDQKVDYKFPHHKTKGGPANLGACRNGLARLSGASIPSGDQSGVKAHLQAHLDDAKSKGDNMYRNRATSHFIANLASGDRRGFRIANRSNQPDTSDVYIYDEIGFFAVNASDFVGELNAINTANIDLHVNSPGGDLFDGMAILQALRDHPAHITAYVDSLAASAASFIIMGADEIVMAPNASLMIHDGFSIVIGNADDMRKQADLLDKMSQNIASIYAARTSMDVDVWRDAMREETWYLAQEAVDVGLADRIAEDKRAVTDDVSDKWDVSIYARKRPIIKNDDGGEEGGGGYEPDKYTPHSDETVTCPKCGKKNDTDAVYCDQCGTKLEGRDDVKTNKSTAIINDDAQPTCPTCGKFNNQDAKSCKHCGADMAGSGDDAPSEEQEEDEPNPSPNRTPTSAKFDPEIFRSAIARIGKM